MGFWIDILGIRNYFDRKFEEFLKVIEEGFALRDDRILRLEQREPIVKYQVVERVETEELKKELFEEIKDAVLGSKDAPIKEISGSAKGNSATVRLHLNGLSALTHTEKKIFSTLLNSEVHMSYKDIAQKLGKSRKTVQTHILNMQNKTDAIQSSENEDYMKTFYINPEVKVKILTGTLH